MFLCALVGSLLVFHAAIVFPLVLALIVMAVITAATRLLSRTDPVWVPCELTDELTELYRRLSLKGEQNHDSTRTIQTSHRLHRHRPYGEPHGLPVDPGPLSADRL